MKDRTYKMILAALFAALTVVGAYIRIPFVPVSFTLQLFFVIFAGLMLGAKAAAASQILYMVLGLVGLPVFSGGGGFQYIFSPSFGYILGFVAGAFTVGAVAGKLKKQNFFTYMAASLWGIAVIYVFGVTWLYFVLKLVANTPSTLSGVLVSGFLVFLPGDLLKAVLACVLTVELRKRAKFRLPW